MRNTFMHDDALGSPLRIATAEQDASSKLIPLPTYIGKRPNTVVDARRKETWLALIETADHAHGWRFRSYLLAKRLFDIVVAGIAIIGFSPLFALAALAIRCESCGPIIFRQARVGKDGTLFVMFKFRTMIPDRRTNRISYHGSDRRVTHKTKSDPRVTRVGRILRRASIDELPQLFNVLRGEMSLVGPRPELPRIVERYAPWQHLRHRVKPGMTGWWQVQGRSDLPMHEHTELDLYYIVHQSFALDMMILFRTFRAVLQRSGSF